MNVLRAFRLLTACLAVICVSEINSQSATAQVYYYYGAPVVAPVYPLPAPSYVVYSPSYLGWRSAGYYGGNWGPYYYQPAMMAPYVSGTMIWPNTIPASPPVVYYGSPW